jgi:hypothetical protein
MSGEGAVPRRMRLEGFEPPTSGLEGRRSSTELQAPCRQGTAAPGVAYSPRELAYIPRAALDSDPFGYGWLFLPAGGGTFADSGFGIYH